MKWIICILMNPVNASNILRACSVEKLAKIFGAVDFMELNPQN